MSRSRTYDHRLKELILNTENPDLFPELKIPRSTAMGWIRNGIASVVTHESLEFSRDELIEKNLFLKNELKKEKAKQELTTLTFKIFGLQIQFLCLPSADCKKKLMRLIQSSSTILTLKICLELIGLSSQRYHAWKNVSRIAL